MKKRVLVISLVLLTLLTVVLMTSCDEEGFGDIRGLSSVTLPKSLSVIGYKAFENCEKLQTLNYRGTQSEWNAVTKVEPYADYNVVYEYDGE